MAFTKYYDANLPSTQPACILLRSKAMYVTGDLRNPEHPDEAGCQYCWCLLTQRVMGPDQQEVNRNNCVPGRECYREAY
ncbi:MAG TPA: hypothetical protein PLV92_05625 [Pirellulaceae bacterium]|nr:hypothetical protein [Pirellulaceae bacterium]